MGAYQDDSPLIDLIQRVYRRHALFGETPDNLRIVMIVLRYAFLFQPVRPVQRLVGRHSKSRQAAARVTFIFRPLYTDFA